jgi:hypothetical protein
MFGEIALRFGVSHRRKRRSEKEPAPKIISPIMEGSGTGRTLTSNAPLFSKVKGLNP